MSWGSDVPDGPPGGGARGQGLGPRGIQDINPCYHHDPPSGGVMARRAPDAVLALDEATGPGGDLEQFVRHLAWAKQVGVHGYGPMLTSWSLCWYVGVHGCSCEGGVRGVGLKHVYTPTCLQATHTNLRFALDVATHSMQTKAGDKHSCHGTMTCRLASPSLCPKVIADITDITTSRTSTSRQKRGQQVW